MSWNDAHERCQQFGGFLPSCKSPEHCDLKDLLPPQKLYEMFIQSYIVGDGDVLGDITFIDLHKMKVNYTTTIASLWVISISI